MYFGFSDISIHYGPKEVVTNITIEFPKAQTTTIIGANGSGKSSLLKTISRAVKPSRGHVVLEGKPLVHYRPKDIAKKIAYLPQIHTSPTDIDVKTLVSYGRYPYKRFGKGLSPHDKKIIEETIEITGLKSIVNRPLELLSGGERQRAWIAMTLCQKPDIMVLDEPITYLDIGHQLEVMELIKSLGSHLNMTIVMVLHDINLAARYSHRMLALKNQKIHVEGVPYDVLSRNHLNAVYDIDAQIHHDAIHQCPFIIPEKYTPYTSLFHKEDV